MVNKGAVALVRVARRRRFRLQREIAIELGFDEPRISRLLSGKIKPNRAESIRLRDQYGIDPALWDAEATELEAEEIGRGLREQQEAKTGTGDS